MKLPRQPHHEHTSARHIILHGYSAAVSGYNFKGNTKPQPEVAFAASGFFGPVETVEDIFLVAVGDTDTGIAYGNLEEILPFLAPGQCQAHLAAFGSITDGIVQQDLKNLSDAFRIADTPRQRCFRHGEGEGQPLLAAQGFKSFVGIGA